MACIDWHEAKLNYTACENLSDYYEDLSDEGFFNEIDYSGYDYDDIYLHLDCNSIFFLGYDESDDWLPSQSSCERESIHWTTGMLRSLGKPTNCHAGWADDSRKFWNHPHNSKRVTLRSHRGFDHDAFIMRNNETADRFSEEF